MFVRCLKDCKEFTAGDGSLLREILHPDNEDLKIRYSLAYAMVAPRQRTKPHRLKASEVYYVLEGKGLMHIGYETHEVGAGSAIYIPPVATQYIENTGDRRLKFLCIVDPAWRKEDEELVDL
jgi:mannose-6-phosphate isomerase-like protein (cupin superfamily)